MSRRLIIIDGNSLVYRAFYATVNNTEENSALKTFIKMYYKLVDESVDYAVVIFDGERPSYRLDVYPEYKATRKERPEGLDEQMELIKEFLNVIGVKVIVSEIYEADDYIGTISKRWSKVGTTSIVTSDKDLLQLIDEKTNVSLIKNMQNVIEITLDNIVEEVGLSPKKFILYKSIAGDPADNIKGIAGIGHKGALEIAEKFNNFEEVEKELEKENCSIQKYKNKLTKDLENGKISEFLTTIVTDVEIGPLTTQEVYVPKKEWEEVEQFYNKYRIVD